MADAVYPYTYYCVLLRITLLLTGLARNEPIFRRSNEFYDWDVKYDVRKGLIRDVQVVGSRVGNLHKTLFLDDGFGGFDGNDDVL